VVTVAFSPTVVACFGFALFRGGDFFLAALFPGGDFLALFPGGDFLERLPIVLAVVDLRSLLLRRIVALRGSCYGSEEGKDREGDGYTGRRQNENCMASLLPKIENLQRLFSNPRFQEAM
jgi:hypothetical protein